MTGPSSAAAPLARSSPASGGSASGGSASGDSPRAVLAAGLAPAISAAVLIALLAAWVLTGGAGTLRRTGIQVTHAAIPLPWVAGTPEPPGAPAPAYLVISNRGGADELTGASSPAGRVVLVRSGRAAPAGANLLPRISVPAGATLSLTSFGADLVLVGAPRLRIGERIPLRLSFRRAGTVTVIAVVSAPGGL